MTLLLEKIKVYVLKRIIHSFIEKLLEKYKKISIYNTFIKKNIYLSILIL